MEGTGGVKQRNMLSFLKTALAPQIAEENRRYWEERQALQQEAEVPVETLQQLVPAEPTTTPIKVFPIHGGQHLTMKDLVDGKLGNYLLKREDDEMLIELKAGLQGNYFLIKRVTGFEWMNNSPEKDSVVYINTISTTYPDLDTFIRNQIFQATGTKIATARPNPRRHINDEKAGTRVTQEITTWTRR